MRPSWDEYFIELVNVIKKRSTCCRRQVGALIVRNNKILSTGYNGSPVKLEHCDQVGCLRDKFNVPSGERHELCRGVHAEQNSIAHSASEGVNISGSTIYITNQPCVLCAKMIINSGIKRVVYEGEYPDALAIELLESAGVEILNLNIKQ